MTALARLATRSSSGRAALPARAPAAAQWRLSRGRRAATTAVRVVAFTEDKVVTATDVVVKLSIPYKTAFGQQLKAVGSPSSLGAWDVKAALPLEWSTGDVWQGELRLPAGLYEFKVVVVDSVGQVQWESCANRALEVPATPGLLEVPCTWNSHLLDPRFTTTTTTTTAAEPVEEEPSLAAAVTAAAVPAVLTTPTPAAAAQLIAPLSAVLATEPPPVPEVEEVAAAVALLETGPIPAPPEAVPALDAIDASLPPTALPDTPPPTAAPLASSSSSPVLDVIEEPAAPPPPPSVEAPRAPAAMTPVMGSLEVVAAETDLAAAPLHLPRPEPATPAPATPALAAEGAAAATLATPAPPEPPVAAAAAGEVAEAVVTGVNGTTRKDAAAAAVAPAMAEGEATAAAARAEQRQAVLASSGVGGNGRRAGGVAVPAGVPPALQELYASDTPAGKFVRFLIKGSWDS